MNRVANKHWRRAPLVRPRERPRTPPVRLTDGDRERIRQQITQGLVFPNQLATEWAINLTMAQALINQYQPN